MGSGLNKQSVKDIDVTGKRVLMRVDFNVPQTADGDVADNKKIEGALPTIRYLVEQGAKIILIAHLGRPKGNVVETFRLDPVAARLAALLGKPVKKLDDCIGDAVHQAVNVMQNGDVIMLENVRFHKEETDNDEHFAKQLARIADVFVNDAFGSVHRAHASTVGVTRFLPAVAGLLVEKEISLMGKALTNPDRPFALILGGSKVADKIEVLNHLSDTVDALLIGGGMAFTFLKAQGHAVGTSLVEEDKVDIARSILDTYAAKGKRVLLPVDVVVANSPEHTDPNSIETVPVTAMPADRMGLDIGAQTAALFSAEVAAARTVIWNGPLGVFEVAAFAEGTITVAKALAASPATSIVGGGDTVASVELSGMADAITHLSTGGGASLEFLEGKELPGIAALNDR